jgi:ligand-binding sensor domain-containing protein
MRLFPPWQTNLARSAVLVVGALLAFRGVGAPRDYLIDTWRFDDDLPRDGIISMAQGADGYLWVSSRYGLARFDGVRFVNFSGRTGAQFLGHHYANLQADPSGAVWIGTPGGGLLQWREPETPSLGPSMRA